MPRRTKDQLGYRDRFGNLMSTQFPWRKGRSPRCPNGHRYCDDHCKASRQNARRKAVLDERRSSE